MIRKTFNRALSRWPPAQVGVRTQLSTSATGCYGVLHLGLGAFRELTVGHRKIARRFLGDAIEIRSTASDSARFHQPRDFEEFANWLEDYSMGLDYFIDASEMQIPATSAFRFFLQPGRYDKFDKGETVEWVANVRAANPGWPAAGPHS